MTIALLSLHNAAFQPLADYTWTNKEEYATRHGYAHACKTQDFYNVVIGYEKIFFVRDMLDSCPDVSWFWWTGCDSMITNFNKKIEDLIDDNYHFIIATDCNGINADSFLVRNSPEGRAYIEMIANKLSPYQWHHWAEQQCIIDTYEDNRNIVKIIEQRAFNSYDYGLYPECTPIDKNGNDGQWQPGDLLIHWPGTSLPHRLHLASYYSQQVIK